MPKQVDHDERRRQIAGAVWRIAAQRGLEAVSMREVALEAGVSIGRVQHYFASKDEIVLFATGHLREQIERRLAQGIAAAPRPLTPQRTLRAILLALLPTDAEGRTGALVGIAMFIRALNEPGLAARYRQGRVRLVTAVTEQIASAAPDADAELTAQSLLALVSGLSSDLLLGHLEVPDALRLLDHHLARESLLE
jgi:TetR/AcrR family transcriptional regulator, transcriptional repressor of bet genes